MTGTRRAARRRRAAGGRAGRGWDCRGRWWAAWSIRNGIEQFGITETAIEGAAGSFAVQLSVAFVASGAAGGYGRGDSAGES